MADTNTYNDILVTTIGGKIAVRSDLLGNHRLIRISDGMVIGRHSTQAGATARANDLVTKAKV